jgi:glycosyltransferase involved in cell wall biosynthesis
VTTRVALIYHFNDRDWLGGKNYFASLLRAVERIGPVDLQFVFVTGRTIQTTIPEEFPSLEVVRTSLLDRWHVGWLTRQVTLRTADWDPLLASLLRGLRIDISSHFGYFGPNPGFKTLAWLYDFQFMHLPEYWQPKHIRWAEKRYRASARQCDALVLSSGDALNDLRKFAPWCTVPQHVLRFVSNPVDHASLLSRQQITDKYSLPNTYFFLPNQFWTNKNHRLAIDALVRLRQRGIDATIVCTGKTEDGRRPEYFQELMTYRDQAGVADQFRVLGIVPYRDTQALMAHARAVINPSRFEGWSTAVEEAKTMHKQLLLSDIPVHREQAPRLGRFFSPDQPDVLADLMHSCLNEPEQHTDVALIQQDYQQRLTQFGETYLGILRSLQT